MNEYAVFCKVELMLLVDAEDEHQARLLAAGTQFSDWDCFISARGFRIELLGPSEEQDEQAREIGRRHREKDLNESSDDYAEESHGR